MHACSSTGNRCLTRIASATHPDWQHQKRLVLSRWLSSSSILNERSYKAIRPNTLGPRRKWVDHEVKEPSLAKQLLPSGLNSPTHIARPERDLPRLPLDSIADPGPRPSQTNSASTPSANASLEAKSTTVVATDDVVPALWIENASRNLTIEDFRRLIPRGKHIQGWTLDRGDIIKVFPSRFPDDLRQNTWYYLIFSSQESAQAYKSYVEKVHLLAKRYMSGTKPSLSMLPTRHDMNDKELADILPNYALLSPDQELALRSVSGPVTRYTRHLLQYGGLQIVLERPGKMPYELRLTLDGPQYSVSRLRSIFSASGKDRDLNWSGTFDSQLRITNWSSSTLSLEEWTRNKTLPKIRPSNHRIPDRVYVIGFESEHAAQSFMYYWHNRPLNHRNEVEERDAAVDEKELGDEPPPIAR